MDFFYKNRKIFFKKELSKLLNTLNVIIVETKIDFFCINQNKIYFCCRKIGYMSSKIIIFFLSFLFLNIVQYAHASDVNKESGSSWELINDDSGIQVLERWVINEKNLKVKERSGKMVLNCSVTEVLNLICDTKRTHLWMRNAEQVDKLKTVSDKEWYVHTILDTPWPFNKQDIVSKYTIVDNAETDVIMVVIVKEDKLLPPQKDIDRLDTFSAVWTIEKVKKNRVKVSFTTKSTKPPKYPSWVQDPIVRNVFFNNMKNFKYLLNKA